MQIPWIDDDMPLPAPESAQPQGSNLAGLVAAGGGLSVSRLCEAYQQGMFPWYSQGQPVLWWSPDPRMVLKTSQFKLHRSLDKTLHKFIASPSCEIRIDHAFNDVIQHCAQIHRKGQPGTWIVDDMVKAYQALHQAGVAHSVETWIDGTLVGGLYCVAVNGTIFGESMFARQTDASKIALAALVGFARRREVNWIDCQQNTKHLASLGAQEMPRKDFIQHIRDNQGRLIDDWSFSDVDWQMLWPKKAIA